MINIPASKLYIRKKKFDLNDYKTPFFFKEVNGYKTARYPSFKNKSFWKPSLKHKKKKVLIISGPGRSGNHLLNSLIDGNKSFTRVAGEDSFIANLLNETNKNEKNLIKNIKSGRLNFYLRLSQFFKKNFIPRNKWQRVYNTSILYSKKNYKNRKFFFKKWYYRPSGNQPPKSNYILDYKNFIPNLDYIGFKKYFRINKKKFLKVENVFDFIFLYFDALKVLMRSEKKKYTYNYILFNSGMRRESYFLLKNLKESILLCPIREFDGMLLSFLKARHNFKKNQKLEKKKVFLYWEFWRHKTIDYLFLQKKFPKRVFIVSYENLIKYPEKSMRLIFKKLNVNFEKINKYTTIQDKPVSGNSSFNIKSQSQSQSGKVYKNNFLKEFKIKDKVKMSNEYYDILKYLNKKVINKF